MVRIQLCASILAQLGILSVAVQHVRSPQAHAAPSAQMIHDDGNPLNSVSSAAATVVDGEMSNAALVATMKRHSHKSHERQQQNARASSCAANTFDDSCRSMCRWLKMVDTEISPPKYRCRMFEWQLQSCNVNPTEEMHRMYGEVGSETTNIQCAVDILRTPVTDAEVGGYVEQIEDCLDQLPRVVNESCYVGLNLLRNEIHDWRVERSLRDDAAVVRQELLDASDNAEKALQTKENVQECIDALSTALSRAEAIPGHFLVQEVHTARGYLDRLGPIPSVRAQLKAAMEDGHHAFETTSLFRVKEAMVWLQVATDKAARYELTTETAPAQELLVRLEALKAALLELRTAIFQGNVSLTTQSGVAEAIAHVTQAIADSTAAGLTNDMPVAHDILDRLQLLQDAVDAEHAATVAGQSVLDHSNKTRTTLASAISRLNKTIAKALSLGLEANVTTTDAEAVLDELAYISHAREALYKATSRALEVLHFKGTLLSDDFEEAARSELSPAITWAEEVGLVRGITWAKGMVRRLTEAEHAKENMVHALAVGNATIKAKSRVKVAVRTLTQAIAICNDGNVTAGVEEARDMIEILQMIIAARDAIAEASAGAQNALRTRTGYRDAFQALNVSIHDGIIAGLHQEVEIAEEQLEKLEEFASADEALMKALARTPPARAAPNPIFKPDLGATVKFNRSGLRPEDLPEVAGGIDDGDRDFAEHEKALEQAIKRAKSQGLVDPGMRAQLADERDKERAYTLEQAAIKVGEDAMKYKRNIDDAITVLSGAIREARETHLQLDVGKAQELLDELLIIQPARDELKAAILQGNVSLHTVNGMDAALIRLNAAVELNQRLELTENVATAMEERDVLLALKKATVGIRAAVLQCQVALRDEAGEEAAIQELNQAIEAADAVNLHKMLPLAVDCLHNLIHMNAQHQQLQAAMDPQQRR